MKSFANALLDSILAAAFVGPKQGILASFKQSARPFAKGASGPTTTKSILFSLQYLTTLLLSFGSRHVEGKFSILKQSCVPAFPGAKKTRATCFDWASFQARECSLPPPPIKSTLSPILIAKGPNTTKFVLFNPMDAARFSTTCFFHHRKPILYVCLIGFLWYHGVERNISKCMGWNQLWRYLGEYWNKLNFTCLICSWSLSWFLVAISSHFNRLKWLEIATRDQERLQLQMRQVKFNLFQYSPRYCQSWFQPIHLLIFRSTPWYHRKPIKHT